MREDDNDSDAEAAPSGRCKPIVLRLEETACWTMRRERLNSGSAWTRKQHRHARSRSWREDRPADDEERKFRREVRQMRRMEPSSQARSRACRPVDPQAMRHAGPGALGRVLRNVPRPAIDDDLAAERRMDALFRRRVPFLRARRIARTLSGGGLSQSTARARAAS